MLANKVSRARRLPVAMVSGLPASSAPTGERSLASRSGIERFDRQGRRRSGPILVEDGVDEARLQREPRGGDRERAARRGEAATQAEARERDVAVAGEERVERPASILGGQRHDRGIDREHGGMKLTAAAGPFERGQLPWRLAGAPCLEDVDALERGALQRRDQLVPRQDAGLLCARERGLEIGDGDEGDGDEVPAAVERRFQPVLSIAAGARRMIHVRNPK